MSLTARYPDFPGTRVRLTKRSRLLGFLVDQHIGSSPPLRILLPRVCWEYTAILKATEFQGAVIARYSENRAAVGAVTAGGYKCGRRNLLFFFASFPYSSAPPSPPQSRPPNSPRRGRTAHQSKTAGAAPRTHLRHFSVELLLRGTSTVSSSSSRHSHRDEFVLLKYTRLFLLDRCISDRKSVV